MIKRFPILLRTVAVTLLIAMVYYFAGYRLVYSFVMHSAKEEAAFAIHHDGVITSMTLSAEEYANIKWTEKNKEFAQNGMLYDIVNLSRVGASYMINVYTDKNETHWVKAMNDFVKCLFPGSHTSPNHAEALLSAFQKEYTPHQNIKIAYTPVIVIGVHYQSGQKCPVSIAIKPIWHPPAC
jgi:hypothetical protein